MLEIVIVIMLCKKISNMAVDRGRSSGGFIALTISLWVGLEVIGVVIGTMFDLDVGAYALGFAFALIGGMISFIIAYKAKPLARPAGPAKVDIVSEPGAEGENADLSFTLNGEYIGTLRSGRKLSASTDKRKNILVANDGSGKEIDRVSFDAQGDGFIELHFTANRFMPEKSIGLLEPQAGAADGGKSEPQTL